MKTIKVFLTIVMSVTAGCCFMHAQSQSGPVKISHAEPLFQDLVRDLGARKGEKEFNIGADFSSTENYKKNGFLAEYEFAPINRLGLEIETDFSFYDPKNKTEEPIPESKLEGLRFSAQYTFLVSQKAQLSLAVGYTQVLEFNDFQNLGKGKLITGLGYSPFFVAAKKWGSNFHTLLYAYPMFENEIGKSANLAYWQINTSLIYTLPGTKHFIGIEVNKEINGSKMVTTLRPQAKIKMNTHFAVGIVTGIPLSKTESNSSFIRLIYEP